MSWLNNLFAGQQPAAPAPQPQQQQQVQQPASQPVQPTQQATTSVQQPTQTAQNPQNPLDMLMTLGQTSSNGQDSQAPTLSIPQDTLAKVASSIDYSKAIPPEALQALQGGDMTALGTILNSVLQNQYQTIMQHNTALTDKFVKDHSTHAQSGLQQSVRGSLVESSINLADMHPLAQNMFKQTARQIAQANPQASPAEVEASTWKAMEELSGQFNRTQKAQLAAVKATEVDYGAWMDSDKQ